MKRHYCVYVVLDAVVPLVLCDNLTKRCGHKAQVLGYTKLPFARHPQKTKRAFHRLPAEEETESPRYQKPQLHIIFSKTFICMLSYFIAEVGSGIRFWFVVHPSMEKPVLDCSDISFLAMCTLYDKVDWTELSTQRKQNNRPSPRKFDLNDHVIVRGKEDEIQQHQLKST
jgi:hypothetical protein